MRRGGRHTITMSIDRKNAFNSWDRSVMWPTLQQRFPKLLSLLRLMYVKDGPVFFINGEDTTTIRNNAGSRQGCAFGSLMEDPKKR